MTSYPSDEQALRAGITNLMQRWEAALPDDLRERFVPDGFYPNYTHQRNRLLFIGREAYGMTGCDYVDVFDPIYRCGYGLGRFHRNILYIAWGLLNRIPRWQDIPDTTEIAEQFGKTAKEGGLSFAFMNANKCSNESGNTPTNWAEMDRFLGVSMPFIREEIALLRPDVVISMNLNDNKTYYEGLGQQYLFHTGKDGDVALHRLPDGTLFLDVWHFSAQRKDSGTQRYEPIVEALQHPDIRWW